MATKQARGTKRTCQSSECGARFYDLNRNPITCPICGSIYELASSPLAVAAAVGEEKASRRGRKSDYADKTPVDATAEAETDEALPEIEEDGEAIAADEDETFLEEEEEEGGDVSNIIGGPVTEGDEER
ncbi:TIGR02300 family protein [Hyphomicrobium sp.]|uniref:TIGR02300 family protein n=1 Tax=Hyphomicrobium sp. TaxID=82 RepID=UPI0025C17CB3|nr:TIGR02300 family protein [Hyphomicrobium sp.]MCC7251705.1 TIGR02300 family protein [Hyphomicrobium sp.]